MGPVSQAFSLEQESAETCDAYGKGRFGQGCLMARRLIEQGVPFVEVSLGSFAGGNIGWDTHQDNFTQVQTLSEELAQGWSTLMRELKERNLLESTTILWMGEFVAEGIYLQKDDSGRPVRFARYKRQKKNSSL